MISFIPGYRFVVELLPVFLAYAAFVEDQLVLAERVRSHMVLRSFKWNFFFELRRDAVVEHDLFYIVSTRDSVRTSQFDVP
eukprot:CAMPEP_0168348704 /NCGR_PEP_ID=MMETSP0213-20121227/19927_1 /TAXON_ID=151035 /ORGANISM="Euplotes harpa, Strain FSP1.4" /LENGTH=80 /DNA_ID=CAMNT_0008358401 /DNA_START=476 /DNA_END=715 /DNA_ORIENTATION=-